MNDFRVNVFNRAWFFEPLTESAKNFTNTDLQIPPENWVENRFFVTPELGNELITSLEDEKFVIEIVP